jgi:hypothetical protein
MDFNSVTRAPNTRPVRGDDMGMRDPVSGNVWNLRHFQPGGDPVERRGVGNWLRGKRGLPKQTYTAPDRYLGNVRHPRSTGIGFPSDQWFDHAHQVLARDQFYG